MSLAPESNRPEFSWRQDGSHDELLDFVRGVGSYTSDFDLPHQCHAVFVRSPYAHARIVSIDLTNALACPGVQAVITGADLQEAGLGTIDPLVAFNGQDGKPMFKAGIPVLAWPQVRHVGEAVALVVARDRLAATHAAEQVLVQWEPLPAITDPCQAIESDQIRIHAHCPNNLALDWADGDEAQTEQIFRQAAHVESVDLAEPALTACSMEPRAAIASWDAQAQRLTLIASTQGVMVVRKILAEHVFRIPPQSLRVLTPHVGGGFGAKVQAYPEYAAILFASKRIGLPVKWVATRLEAFLTDTHARNSRLRARMAFDARGRILGLSVDNIVGIGAYTSTYMAIVGTNNTKNCLSSVYRVPSIRIRSRLALTNAMPHGPYRGAGRPEAIYLIERLIDQAAISMGMDRVSLRQRNLITPPEMPYQAPNGQLYDSGDFPQALTRVLHLAQWDQFEERRQRSARQGHLRGIGLCCFLEVAGGILEEPADLRFPGNGEIHLHLGSQAMGQGHLATYPALVAGRLGIDLARIRLIAGDSDATPGLVATVASRSTMMAGSATALACDEAIRRGRLITAHLLEVDVADILFQAGRFTLVGTDRSIALLDLAKHMAAVEDLPPELPTSLDNVALFTSSAMTYPNGAHVSEVEINPDTGEIQILQHTAVDDVGTVLNSEIVNGQIMGGVLQALGQVLGEQLVYDADGQLQTASLMDYSVLRADVSPNFVLEHQEIAAQSNPLGVKGAGESGVAGALPAAVNAILHALSYRGIQHMDLPFTSGRVWAALHRS